MQTNNLLHNFEYAVFPPVSCDSYKEIIEGQVAAQLPILSVRVNFQIGRLVLEGDWRFLMACNKNALPHWLLSHLGRIRIDANIYPAGAIDLVDLNSDGLLYPVEGVINDGSSINFCSGLIVLDRRETNPAVHAHEWTICFNLYDYEADNSEITFALPVYLAKGRESNNEYFRGFVS
jgi:hypothetical protein